MKVDKYYIRAKLFPTVLTAVPVILFFNNFIAPLYNENLANVFTTLPAITNATFSAALVFLLILLNRFCAKEIFQKIYFQDELKMPTTNHLLWEDSFLEDSIKRKIRTKIRDKYDITLLSREEEAAEEIRGRKLIRTAVSQIRISLKDNPMLLDHNIHFGFFRNLVGGSLLALIFSILILILAYIFSYQTLKIFSLLLIVAYLIPLLLSNFFIKKHGDYYSKILYEQFINLPNH